MKRRRKDRRLSRAKRHAEGNFDGPPWGRRPFETLRISQQVRKWYTPFGHKGAVLHVTGNGYRWSKALDDS